MPIEVRRVKKKGRCVFARQDFNVGDVVEVCHVALFKVDDKQHHPLLGYCFQWKKNVVAIALGHGSLYSHSHRANCSVSQSVKQETLTLTAHRPIRKGDEITINYLGHPDQEGEVWFDMLS